MSEALRLEGARAHDRVLGDLVPLCDRFPAGVQPLRHGSWLPSERLQELHRQILCHDPILVGGRPPPSRTAAPREEGKLVTSFAELTDVTANAEQLGPEDIRAFLRPSYAHIRSDLERFGGTVEKFIGDSVPASFGVPAADEDDPERKSAPRSPSGTG